LFADDTNLQLEATNALTLTDIIKEVMQQLSSWFRLNKLVINPDKTIAMSFHAPQNKNNPTPRIIFQDMIIKYKNETRFLGIHLTDDVKWDVHVKYVCNISLLYRAILNIILNIQLIAQCFIIKIH